MLLGQFAIKQTRASINTIDQLLNAIDNNQIRIGRSTRMNNALWEFLRANPKVTDSNILQMRKVS